MSNKENVSRFVLPEGAEFRGVEVNDDGVVSVLYVERKATKESIITPKEFETMKEKQEASRKVNVTTAGLWTQDKTNVSKGKLTLEVGSRITGYEANGISDWYVLGAEDGHLLIATNACSENVRLRGREDYTNGVKKLDEASEKYTNPIYADGARSITVDDINRVTGYNPETAGYGEDELGKYGSKVKFYWDGSNYPYYLASNFVTGEFYSSHRLGFYYPTTDGFNCSQKSITATESNKEEITILTNTYYGYDISTYLPKSCKAYQLLVNGKTYWLGSQYVNCYSYNMYVGLRYVDTDGYVGKKHLAYSYGDENRCYCDVLPVVTLKPDVQIDKDGKIS